MEDIYISREKHYFDSPINLIREYYKVTSYPYWTKESHIYRSKQKLSNTYVYLFYNSLTGLYKIGMSDDIKRRFASLQCQVGCSLNPILALELDWYIDEPANYIESFLHKYFKKKNVIGEWFSLNDADILEITELFYQIEGEGVFESDIIECLLCD